MNTELTAKQIARIERIRAERAERRVDQRDSPNVAPYKKCAFCHERSSCGNYTDDDQWQCESCAPEEEEEPMNCWQLFYNGTALVFPYERQTELIALWESTIIAGLRSGVSIEQQKKECKEDLDEMEKWICDIMGNEKGYTNADVEKNIGKKDYCRLLNKWGLNVVCGLKLKVIVNDDKNGHLFMCVKSSSAV
jgi:hypothetical protein